MSGVPEPEPPARARPRTHKVNPALATTVRQGFTSDARQGYAVVKNYREWVPGPSIYGHASKRPDGRDGFLLAGGIELSDAKEGKGRFLDGGGANSCRPKPPAGHPLPWPAPYFNTAADDLLAALDFYPVINPGCLGYADGGPVLCGGGAKKGWFIGWTIRDAAGLPPLPPGPRAFIPDPARALLIWELAGPAFLPLTDPNICPTLTAQLALPLDQRTWGIHDAEGVICADHASMVSLPPHSTTLLPESPPPA